MMKIPVLDTVIKEEVKLQQQEEEHHVDREKKTTSGFRNHLGPKTRETELRLGFSINSHDDDNMGIVKQRNGGFGATKRWFSETQGGFGNQWSLGSNKEKAVFQQNHHHQQQQLINTSTPTVPRAPPVVGWPPIRTFRRNFAPPLKSEMESKVGAMTPTESMKKSEASMYVKVNMEGYAVGRKINLKAYDNYESLSWALQEMFDNFFSVNNPKNLEHAKEEVATPEHVLLYEDNEGDRMLVGDVPWEMFINTVKRLYIITGSRAPTFVGGRDGKTQE